MTKKIFILFITILLSGNFSRAAWVLNSAESVSVLPALWPVDLTNHEKVATILNGELDHPLSIGMHAFAFLFHYEKSNDTASARLGFSLLSYLDDYPYQKKEYGATAYIYPIDHKVFKAKEWWSGMANAVIGMAYLQGYLLNEEPELLHKAQEAIQCLINPVEKNGSAITLNDSSSWYLEYADAKRTKENSFFVHNGFMFSLMALKYFYQKTGEELYHEAYMKGKNALKLREELYYYGDKKWTYYMTNPLTIESAHYAIYEILILESLKSYDEDPFYEEKIAIRRKIIKENYAIKADKFNNYTFCVLAAPHPYWPDIYPTKITGYSGKEKGSIVIYPRDMKREFLDRSFCKVQLLKALDSIQVAQVYNDHEIQIFTQVPQVENPNPSYLLNTIESFAYQASPGKKKTAFNISGTNTQNRAMLKYSFQEPADFYHCLYFGFVFNADVEVTSIRIDLINKDTLSAGRYYIPQPKNQSNLVLLKGVSFEYYEQLKNKEITQMQVSFYYDEFSEESRSIRFTKPFIINDPDILLKILSNQFGTCNLVEKTEKGNIY